MLLQMAFFDMDEYYSTVLLLFSHLVLSNSSVTAWTVALQAPMSMDFSRQEYWSGLPFPFPGDLPNPGIESMSPALQVNLLPVSHQGSPFQCICSEHCICILYTYIICIYIYYRYT